MFSDEAFSNVDTKKSKKKTQPKVKHFLPLDNSVEMMNHLEKIFLELHSDTKQEVGDRAIWSLSSAKPGSGVEQLRDGRVETYWQSDGCLPHLVNISFRRKMTLFNIEFYVSHCLDESYTPAKISVRVGNHLQDLRELALLDFNEPEGWIKIPLRDVDNNPIRTFTVQLAILNNHQNGRDTHIRQIKIHALNDDAFVTALDFTPHFSTVELSQSVYLK